MRFRNLSIIASLVLWGLGSGAAVAAPAAVTYAYPPQASLSEIEKTDRDRRLLTDGRRSAEGKDAVWGKWNVKPMTIDWTFERPVRIRAIELSIVHPGADRDNSHPGRVCLYGSDGTADYLGKADACLEIPFEAGRVQQIRLPVTGETVVRKVRTTFEAARFQNVLTEVSFETEDAAAPQLEAAQQRRVAAQPPPLQTVRFSPPPVAARSAPASSFYGVCGHLLHAPPVMTNFSPYWNVDYTVPFVSGRFGWVREPLYQSVLVGEAAGDSARLKANRQEVERALSLYDRAGVRVLLTPMFRRHDHLTFGDFFAWLAELAQRHPSVAAIELHNEPNLGGFWKYTVEDYVESSRQATALLKKGAPRLPVVIGAFSGWGHAQNRDDVKAHATGDRASASNFAEAVFRLGGLAFADGVSAHPYRNSSAPEGGLEIESPTDPRGFEKEIRSWWAMAQRYNTGRRPLKLHFTELGFSSSTTGYAAVGGVERQADYLSRLMLILLDVRVQGTPLETVFWYDLKADDAQAGEYEANFGLVANDTSHVRPGYVAYRRIVEAFGEPSDFSPAAATAVWNNWPAAVKHYAWKRRDGALVVAFWRMNQLQQEDRDFAGELRLDLPAGATPTSVELHDLHEDRPRPVGFQAQGNTLLVPLHVTARAAWIVVK